MRERPAFGDQTLANRMLLEHGNTSLRHGSIPPAMALGGRGVPPRDALRRALAHHATNTFTAAEKLTVLDAVASAWFHAVTGRGLGGGGKRRGGATHVKKINRQCSGCLN